MGRNLGKRQEDDVGQFNDDDGLIRRLVEQEKWYIHNDLLAQLTPDVSIPIIERTMKSAPAFFNDRQPGEFCMQGITIDEAVLVVFVTIDEVAPNDWEVCVRRIKIAEPGGW